jgi:hypothetical protein
MKASVKPALVFVFFVALSILATAPVSLAPHRLATDDGDPLIGSWILAWNAHQVVRAPWRLFDSNSFYPYDDSLAFSEHLFVPALMAAPFYYVSGNALLAHNLTVLLTLALSGFGMYLLVKEVLGRADAGIVAGTIYVFHTYGLHEVARVQIVSLQWWPLALLFLVRLFRGERRGRNAFLFVFFFLLQALSCTYYLFYFALALGFWVPIYAWTSPERWSKLKALLLPGALAAGVMLLFALPYHRVLQRFEFHRGLGEGLDAVEYLRPPEGSLLSSLLSSIVEPSTVPHFLGYLPLLLAAVGLIYAPRKGELGRRFFWLSLATALLGFVLTLGPNVRLDGRDLGPGPYALLYEHLPGFQYLRSPERMSVLVQFGLAVVAAWGAGKLLRRLSSRSSSAARIVLLVLLPLEHFGLRPSTEMPVADETPEVYRWLGSLPDEGAVVELPLYPRAQLRLHSLYMFYSTIHWKPVVFGKTSYYPPLVGYLAWELRDFPSREDLALLRRVGVSHVVVRPNLWNEGERGEKLALLRSLTRELVPEGRFPHLAGRSYARYGFGDERAYRLSVGRTGDASPPLCVPRDAIEPSRWKITGQGATPASWAIDRDPSTKWRSKGQLPGIMLELDLGREETMSAVRIDIAHPYDGFPRDLTLKVWSKASGRFERVVHRDDLATKLEVLDALLDRPLEAGMTLRFPSVRARRIRFWVREGKDFDYALPDWSLPELYVYRSCVAPANDSVDASRSHR